MLWPNLTEKLKQLFLSVAAFGFLRPNQLENFPVAFGQWGVNVIDGQMLKLPRLDGQTETCMCFMLTKPRKTQRSRWRPGRSLAPMNPLDSSNGLHYSPGTFGNGIPNPI
jgi:hypothetical protein